MMHLVVAVQSMLSAIDPNEVAALLAFRAPRLARRRYLELVTEIEQPGVLLDHPERASSLPEFQRSLRCGDQRNAAMQELERWCTLGIRTLVLGTPAYPARLARINDPPLLLFVRGEVPARVTGDGVLAIIGSRQADLETCRVAYELAKRAAEAGGCIVSGLAYGVDSQAHEGALASGQVCPTVAVLGGGLTRIYPAQHEPLADKILAAGGAVLTQFDPESSPRPSNFLDRNRVIAGLSQAVLVIQAAHRSGSLSTARFALEEGRDVLALPGAFGDPRYEGSNNLLKQGAYVVTSFDDLAAVVPGLDPRPARASADLDSADAELLEFISSHASVHCDELIERFGSERELQMRLVDLELAGRVLQLPGNHVAAARKC